MRPARCMQVVVVLALGVLATAGPAGAEPGSCWDHQGHDLDGDGPDVVVGLPSYDLPGKPDAGAIVVFSNVAAPGEADPSTPSASTLVTADDIDGLTSQAGARFGASVVAWGDAGSFDDPDNCSDLLVGAPGQTVDGKAGAGQVSLIKGTGDGLSEALRTFDEASITGAGGAQAGAHFGAALAADTLSMIAIGAPGRDVGSAVDAGHVVRITYPLNDLNDPDVTVVDQGGDNAGTPEAGDRFGEVLDVLPSGQGPILIVGIPHEDIGRQRDAGAVGLLPPSGPLTMVSQNAPGAGGRAEAGDLYGSSVDIYATYVNNPVGIVAIGVPGEDHSGSKNAGAVSYAMFEIVFDPAQYIGPLTGMPTMVTQSSRGVPGRPEQGDRFGSSVLVGEFGTDNGHRQLMATAPREDLGSTSNAGLLTNTWIKENGSTRAGMHIKAWTQDSAGVAGRAESGDRFGARASSVVLTDLEDDDDSIWDILLVTVPGEDVGDVEDAGLAYLGVAPGMNSVRLKMPVTQTRAGVGMVPMR